MVHCSLHNLYRYNCRSSSVSHRCHSPLGSHKAQASGRSDLNLSCCYQDWHFPDVSFLLHSLHVEVWLLASLLPLHEAVSKCPIAHASRAFPCHLVEGDSSTTSSLDAMLGRLSVGRLSLSVNSLSSSIVKAYAPLFSLKCTLHIAQPGQCLSC